MFFNGDGIWFLTKRGGGKYVMDSSFGTEILDIQVSHCGWQDHLMRQKRSSQSIA